VTSGWFYHHPSFYGTGVGWSGQVGAAGGLVDLSFLELIVTR
jgi:hypothetical protein